jgi:Alginate lyase
MYASWIILLIPATSLAAILNRGLDPKCAPGGNFDLSIWGLNLPTGKPSHNDYKQSPSLKGCSGYQDTNYFFTARDGSLVMKVPGSPKSVGCATAAGSKHCRTELRENNSWDPTRPVNRLNVSMIVKQADNSGHGTVIGQVHMDPSASIRPVCELFYNSAGDIVIGVEQTRAGGNLKITDGIGHVPVGQKFSYQLAFENNVLSVKINDGKPKRLSTYSLDKPRSYFQVGNYNQGDNPSDVHVYSIHVTHS